MTVSALRNLADAMLQRIRRAPGRRRTFDRPVREGMPAGVPADVVTQIVVRETNVEPSHIRYEHLSSWKHAGAYRLLVDTTVGSMSIVFKDAQYSPEHIAALEGLPVRPGAPELLVYSGTIGSLASWTPRAIWWHEATPHLRYQYILEDLAADYRSAESGKDLVTLCARLPKLHDDLTAAFGRDNRLQCYDDAFSEKLLAYAAEVMERYGGVVRSADPAVRRLLRRWRGMEQHYRIVMDDAFERLSMRPVHGDLNPSNVLIARDGSADLRLIDWEWAGLGLPHSDLASVLKRASPRLERRALRAYRCHARHAEPYADFWRTYVWCKLQRGLFDASFLAKQRLDSTLTGDLDIDRHIAGATSRAMSALDTLEKGSRTI